MRQSLIFSGSSHPALVDGICERLGQRPGKAELRKFSNGETSVQIQTSIRDQNIFIVQSGSEKINDNVMELLIMINACKGASAKSITAVMPYFPYSRQSKKKSHRGSITARMIANLLNVAGVNHVITIDLHASQMQGFFHCPIDNLVAEPLIARWIKVNVPDWKNGVVVSKNPGGTKRVTSLADALKLSFGIVTTDRSRPGQHSPMNASMIFDKLGLDGTNELESGDVDSISALPPLEPVAEEPPPQENSRTPSHRARAASNPLSKRMVNSSSDSPSSPLAKSARRPSPSSSPPRSPLRPTRVNTAPEPHTPGEDGDGNEYTDERAQNVITGRLRQGHIVDDDAPSPAFSAVSNPSGRSRYRGNNDEDSAIPEHMMSSFVSTASSFRPEHALGGSAEGGQSSEDEEDDLENPELETTVTLVGNVKDRPVFIVDDILDRSGSWIAAAETVIKRGEATQVYCMATHALCTEQCLEELENCGCINKIVVTNTFPISPAKLVRSKKLVVIDVANLLAEAIRRNHHGESISALFMHYD
ncbi:phosphoribosyl pyrophosphokinase [Patellaria atrata CBS 101060]|uniref:Ribose-phosphate pyrophosphokinase 1 n=1 Tax=Patellaria atrata CBS 101060 TaxID=1346257 RepID=A0A9P4S710_9PEZI|nr:phosphoribosyl pyrophosphokinase [Patellaria atrata CBS 101060]